ncbi:MAG: hypothetical protein DPW11_02090 [bacterium]|nr:hypothetical protein [bacterium]RIK50785.1 MAG: hypothetical protein DCC61_04480 [Candidatus Microgenomates bacterium]
MRTIIFDLSDVLIKGLEGVEFSLASYLNLPVEQVFDELFKFDYREFWLSHITESELFTRLIAHHRWDISQEKLKEIIYANFYEIPGTRQLILDLKSRHKLILLSVNSREWATYFENTYNYEYLFENTHYSYEIGHTKREPQSFQYILKKYQLNPENVLLVDDSTRNILVANGVGIAGIKFINADQTRRELEQRKLL